VPVVHTDPLLPGDPSKLGSYHLVGRLGSGGMGTVYLGHDEAGRSVAVKVIRPDLASQPEFRRRFRSEVNRARAVPPFSTAPVLDADPEHATPYLVVEYVDGPDLAQVIAARGPLAGGDLQGVAIGVATALTAIHGAGVVHRDLNPRNVMFSLGTPKVIDFGIARALNATSRHTRTHEMVGTLPYMAPERFEDKQPETGPAADIFSWGVLTTYAGTGHMPFESDSSAETIARILAQPPDLGDLPSPLREIVARTLAKDPADRPTASQLLDMLLTAGPHSIANQPGHMGPPWVSPQDRTDRARRTVRSRSLTAAAVVGALGLLGVWALNERRDPVAPAALPTATIRSADTGALPLLIHDRLDDPNHWQASEDEYGSCTFADGQMVVHASHPGGNSCSGPDVPIPGDQSVGVTVTLLNEFSCGWIGFRRGDTYRGYNLFLCRGKVELSRELNRNREQLRTCSTKIFDVDDGGHRVELSITGGLATVDVDGERLCDARVDDRILASGSIELGVETVDKRPNGRAAFRNAEIHAQ
jgi:eukaryotic-like serine/threonine-protein kinase